ncbi:hypothetical protein KXS11_05785 [Plantibacter flavus]|uniref:hypothetical protein n=1 Tax=Plantibacter flavus TaxID=150123 RepID=UPI003F1675C8
MYAAAAAHPAAAPAPLVLVDVGSRTPDRHDGRDVPLRLIQFADLVRQPLDRGRGSIRDIWTSVDTHGRVRWQLRLVELRDATGTIAAHDGMGHSIVGFAGPQVGVHSGAVERVLHRDEVLTVRSPTLLLSRPPLRASGASAIILLSFTADEDPPAFSFRPRDDVFGAAHDLRIVLALREPIPFAGGEVPRGAALVSAPLAVPPRYR